MFFWWKLFCILFFYWMSLFVCVLILIFAFSNVSNLDELGFGSVFDGTYAGGQFANISTQAVFDLMKHIPIPEESGSAFIEIGSPEIEQFEIPRNETIVPDLSIAHGKWFYIVYMF